MKFEMINESANNSNEKTICLYEDTITNERCPKKAVSRGLCHSHYAVALRIVKKVKGITWNKLVKHGKALPARPPFNGINGASVQRDWFLDFKDNKKKSSKVKKDQKLSRDEDNQQHVMETFKDLEQTLDRVRRTLGL